MVSVRMYFHAAVLAYVVAFLTDAAVAQSDVAAGSVSIETTSMAVGMGFSWGNGVLRFNGKTYPFSIDGVTLIDVGISKSSANGAVYHLSDPAQFEGNYVAAEASFALGGGLGSVVLRNSHGVVMHLNSVSQGARFQLGSAGINIKLWHPIRN